MSKELNSNIESVRVYQAVKFDGKLSTFFPTGGGKYYKSLNIEIIPSIGVSVKNENDHVIIPFPNVGSISMSTEAKTAKSEAHKADISKPAKAQSVSKPKKDPVGSKRL